MYRQTAQRSNLNYNRVWNSYRKKLPTSCPSIPIEQKTNKFFNSEMTAFYSWLLLLKSQDHLSNCWLIIKLIASVKYITFLWNLNHSQSFDGFFERKTICLKSGLEVVWYCHFSESFFNPKTNITQILSTWYFSQCFSIDLLCLAR